MPAKHIYKLKHADKATFYSPFAARATPAPTSKSQEEKEFVIDSETSMHMLSRRDLSSEEMGKCKQMKKHRCMFTISACFVTVEILEDKPAVLSLGKRCEEHRYSYEWVNGQQPRFTEKRKKLRAKRTTSYLLSFQEYPPAVVQGSPSTSFLHDSSSTGPEIERNDGHAPGS